MAQNVAEDVTGQAWHTKVSLFEVLHLKKQQNISNWNYIYIYIMHACMHACMYVCMYMVDGVGL